MFDRYESEIDGTELSPARAIDGIADILDGTAWTLDTLDLIADLVRATGCTVSAANDVDEGELEAHLNTAARLTR